MVAVFNMFSDILKAAILKLIFTQPCSITKHIANDTYPNRPRRLPSRRSCAHPGLTASLIDNFNLTTDKGKN